MAVLGALGHAVRLRIVAQLAEGPLHVSELARRVGISRPLLYMHLERLEKAELVTGRLELSADGRALKYYELVAFDVRLTVESVRVAVQADEADDEETSDGDVPDDEGPDDAKEASG